MKLSIVITKTLPGKGKLSAHLKDWDKAIVEHLACQGWIITIKAADSGEEAVWMSSNGSGTPD